MSFERIVRQLIGDFRYERRWPATVVADNGDNTVELDPDDPAIGGGRGMSRVPVRSGIAGATSRAEPGARCLLAFDDGDPRKPAVVAWEYAKASGTVYLDGGTAPVARNGDLVELLLSKQTPISGTIQGSYVVPGSPPVTVPVPPGTPFNFIATVPMKVYGRVLGGAARVKA